MAKLTDIVAKAMKQDVKDGIVAHAKAAGTTVEKSAGVVGGASKLSKDQARLAEFGLIAKKLRGGSLSAWFYRNSFTGHPR